MDFIRPFAVILSLFFVGRTVAQTPPEIGYLFPPGGVPGSTVDVRIGGYNWTPDMQLFVHDPHIKLELTGTVSEVIVPEPPYWFGKKARDNDFPLPREYSARLTISADAPPGPILWQAANANGAAAKGILVVVPDSHHIENPNAQTPHVIAALPAAVVGQIQKLEEVDRYTIVAPVSGPISLDLWTRRFGSQMNAIVEVRDASNQLVADGADTAGHDLQLTFGARAGERYTISLYDADFRGHRSFVYRLLIHNGPRIVAALPAAGKRGEKASVQFVGYGLATGTAQLETVTSDVQFPAEPQRKTFEYSLNTAFGTTLPFQFPLSDLPELTESTNASSPTVALNIPAAITGTLDAQHGPDRCELRGKKGDVWRMRCSSAKKGLPLDLALTVLDATGKELAQIDDSNGSTDCELLFTVPADGSYTVAVYDQSGQSKDRSLVYWLAVDSPPQEFSVLVPDRLSVTLGEKSKLAVKVRREGNLKGPVSIELNGLPTGVSVASPLVIPTDKSELTVELSCAADAPATAAVAVVKGTVRVDEKEFSQQSEPILLAVVMKPRVKITPEGLDDVRKWPRGSTYLAPVLIERLQGFTGEVTLEQTAHQQRVRQGITGPDFIVGSGIDRVEYPVYLPEWLETTKTSRIILNGLVKVADPQGKSRYLLNKMELRIGMLPVGALLKVAVDANDLEVAANQPFEIPVRLIRAGELTEPVTVEVLLSKELARRIVATPVVAQANEGRVVLQITPAEQGFSAGELPITIRATALRGGKRPVISETTCEVEVVPAR